MRLCLKEVCMDELPSLGCSQCLSSVSTKGQDAEVWQAHEAQPVNLGLQEAAGDATACHTTHTPES